MLDLMKGLRLYTQNLFDKVRMPKLCVSG